MEWKRKTLVFQLQSGLYVGGRELGFILRTRWFVPAKNLWAMTTRAATEWLYKGTPSHEQYKKTGDALDRVMKFTGFYLWTEKDQWLTPKYDPKDGLCWGGLSPAEFAQTFVRGYTSTALDSDTTAAEENALHEVEYLLHLYHDRAKPRPVYLAGEVFYRGEELEVNGGKISVSEIFGDVFAKSQLYLGGESSYGYGSVRLQEGHAAQNLKFDGIENVLDGAADGEAICRFRSGKPVPSFVQATKPQGSASLEGDVELLITREWGENGPGKDTVSHGYCWVPGSIVRAPKETIEFAIAKYGLWREFCQA